MYELKHKVMEKRKNHVIKKLIDHAALAGIYLMGSIIVLLQLRSLF